MTLHPSSGDPYRFGTEAFYAALGRAFVAMCAVVPFLFLIEAVDQGLAFGLDATAGIIPQRIDGLDGVFFSPFLHHGFDHLYSNSIPLILLGTFVLAAGARRFLWSTLVIILVSGLGVWFTGSPNSVVVGASGVIFGYLGILLTRASSSAVGGTSRSSSWSVCSTAGSWSASSPPTSGSPGRATCSACSAGWWRRSCSVGGDRAWTARTTRVPHSACPEAILRRASGTCLPDRHHPPTVEISTR